MRGLVALLVLLAGCSYQEPKLVASSEKTVTIYDPNTRIYYTYRTDSWDVLIRRER